MNEAKRHFQIILQRVKLQLLETLKSVEFVTGLRLAVPLRTRVVVVRLKLCIHSLTGRLLIHQLL